MLSLLLALTPLQDPALLELHVRNAFLERRLAFEAAWDRASEEGRERVRALFRERLKNAGVPAAHQVSSQFLTDLPALLDGRVDNLGKLGMAQRLANSLDILVLPGAFGAGSSGRGDEIIVRVLPLTTTVLRGLPETVDLRLVWLGPEGEEISARSEPVHRAAFAMPGFEMYLRAPSSPPAVWRMVPQVEVGEVHARGFPVPVDCVKDLFPRFDRLAGDPQAEGSARLVALERKLFYGVRDRLTPSISALLDGEALTAPAPVAEEWGGGETVALPLPAESLRELVLVVAPHLEDAAWSLAGDGGEAWRDYADRRGAWIVATSHPVRNPGGADVLGVLAGLRAAHPDLPSTLVIGGSNVARLSLALRAAKGPPPVDRLLLHVVLRGDGGPRRLFELPTLLVEPLDEPAPREVVPGEGAHLSWVRLADPPLLTGRVLAGELGAWLDAREDTPADEDRER